MAALRVTNKQLFFNLNLSTLFLSLSQYYRLAVKKRDQNIASLAGQLGIVGFGEEAGPFSKESIRHFVSEITEQKEKRQHQIMEEKVQLVYVLLENQLIQLHFHLYMCQTMFISCNGTPHDDMMRLRRFINSFYKQCHILTKYTCSVNFWKGLKVPDISNKYCICLCSFSPLYMCMYTHCTRILQMIE